MGRGLFRVRVFLPRGWPETYDEYLGAKTEPEGPGPGGSPLHSNAPAVEAGPRPWLSPGLQVGRPRHPDTPSP